MSSSSSSSLRTACRPHTVLTSFTCSSSSRHQPRSRIRVSFRTPPDCNKRHSSFFSPWLIHTNNNDPWFRVNHKRTIVRAWTEPKSPYETLGMVFSSSLLLSCLVAEKIDAKRRNSCQTSFIFYIFRAQNWKGMLMKRI
jgi:hypothetical protein